MTIAERIERVREHFELADNWPALPFRLNPWSVVEVPTEFVDSHMEMILSGKEAALVLPYLERLESLLPLRSFIGKI